MRSALALSLGVLVFAVGCSSADGAGAEISAGGDGGLTDAPSPTGTSDAREAADAAPPDAALPGLPGLHVEGNHLVDAGKTVRLLGVNHSGAEYSCVQGNGIFEGPTDDSFATAVLAWKANTVRLPLNEDCWLGINGVDPRYSGAAYASAVQAFVTLLRRHGLYVILDLHWNAPGTTLAQHQQPLPDFDHAPDFWRAVAKTFGGTDGVVFDLYNEPYVDASNAQTQDPWACWKTGCTITQGQGTTGSWKAAGMQDLVDAVRGAGATNVIMAGGLAYANDLSGWLAHAPDDPAKNLAASFHEYNFNTCKDATCWAKDLEPLAAAVPVVTGEIGEDDCTHAFIDGYMPWADAHGVSYLGWTWNVWDCKQGPALVTDYGGTPTPFGAGLKAHLATTSP